MNLDLVNNLFNNLKENKLVQNFMKELSNYLENNLKNNYWLNNQEHYNNDVYNVLKVQNGKIEEIEIDKGICQRYSRE